MERKEYYKQNLPHFQQPGQAYFVTWCLKDAVPAHALKRYTDKLEILKSQMGAAGAADSLLEFKAGNLPFINDADRNRHHPGADFTGAADSDPPFIINRRSESASPKLTVPIRIGITRHHPESATPTEKLRKEYYTLRKKYIKAYNDLLDVERNPKINFSKPENVAVLINTLKFWDWNRLQNHAFCIMPNHVHWVFEVFEKDENGEPVYLQDIMYSVKRFSASEINKLENREGKLWQKESFDTTIRDEKHLYYAVEYTLNNPVKAGFVNDWREWRGCWCAD